MGGFVECLDSEGAEEMIQPENGRYSSGENIFVIRNKDKIDAWI